MATLFINCRPVPLVVPWQTGRALSHMFVAMMNWWPCFVMRDCSWVVVYEQPRGEQHSRSACFRTVSCEEVSVASSFCYGTLLWEFRSWVAVVQVCYRYTHKSCRMPLRMRNNSFKTLSWKKQASIAVFSVGFPEKPPDGTQFRERSIVHIYTWRICGLQNILRVREHFLV